MTTAIPEKGKVLTEAEIAQVKETTIFDQASVNYTTLSPDLPVSACANCIFYRSTGFDGIEWPHCHIVDGWPLPIEPTGLCDEWRLNPVEAEPSLADDPVPVYIVDAPDGVESAEMALTVPKSMLAQVREFIGNLGKPQKPQAFAVFKTASGKMAWIARHTGKYIDREGEILAERAHEAYVDRVQKGIVPPPELWMWHAKGTKHGQAVTVWKSGGFVLAAGYFDETQAGKSAFEYYQKNSGKIKLSHMFHYPSVAKINGVYHEYNTIEITTLPDGAEAFPYTSFEEIQTMALPDVAKQMINEALGPEVLQAAIQLDGKALADTAKMDALGIASKNYDQYSGSDVVEAAKQFAAFTAEFTALKGQLEETQKRLEAAESVSSAVKQLEDTVKTLSTELAEAKAREAATLESMKDMQGKLALFTDLKPPASQSNETLLNDREKTLVETMMTQAKVADQPSLVDSLIGGSPTIQTG